jgi:hypothetical protein
MERPYLSVMSVLPEFVQPCLSHVSTPCQILMGYCVKLWQITDRILIRLSHYGKRYALPYYIFQVNVSYAYKSVILPDVFLSHSKRITERTKYHKHIWKYGRMCM